MVNSGKRRGSLGFGGMLILVLALTALTGCEMDSFFNPSVVGRWERTPVTLPILDRLDVIDEPASSSQEITQVRRSDLMPDMREYVIGPSDILTVQIFELLRPGQESQQTREVDATGTVRLQVVGPVKAGGLTPSQLEDRIQRILEEEGILRDAMVSVLMQQKRQRTFSVIGEPQQGGTAVGTYQIPEPDFRLLEAVAMARGVPGRTKKLLVYRQTALSPEAAGQVPEGRPGEGLPANEAPEAPQDPAALIEQMMQDQPQQQPQEQQQGEEEVPAGLESGLEGGGGRQWVNVEGRWVQVGEETETRPAEGANREDLQDLVTQRIIEIPWDRLLEGDMSYNIVIRPGDVIRVPAPTGGFVYVMGQVNRPGTFVVPGENDLTLMQLIASAGNLSQLAIPERVDLIRRVGDNRQAIMRLDLEAIFEGRQPDIFIKPNDTINVGTSWGATPLAIIRNGFRASYGFGFVLDRNFGNDVF